MKTSRQALFGKLGATLYRSVESATSFCKLRGNPYVELVHWLHQQLQTTDSDLHRIIRHAGIERDALDRDMARALSALPAGASSISDFSHHIELAIERAWVLAILSYNDRRVRGAWLTAALVKTPELRRLLLSISPTFSRIPVEALDDALLTWIDGSPEAADAPYDNSDFSPAVPGEASCALPSAAKGSSLDQFCTDLTARARDRDIDPVVGRELEIRTMIDVLLRRRQNNPLLTGEAGVGKTAVVEGLALAIANRDVPPRLADVRLMSLDVGALLAGASMKGELEARLKGVLEAAAKSPVPVILFVDEIHTLIGAGGQAGTGDAANLLNVNRSFKLYGWCSLIRGVESGGTVENLPCHTFPTDDGGVDMKCPTEIAISDRREAELSKNGFIPLIHRKNTDHATFIGAQSLQKPAEYHDADATANANLSARLPYLFACSRFAHYLKCIVRDKIGAFKEREDMQRWLNEWIMHYVDADPVNSSQDTKARRPLAAAEVVVEDVEGNPGYYQAKFFLRPHFQLEGLTVSLRLVAKLPSIKEAA